MRDEGTRFEMNGKFAEVLKREGLAGFEALMEGKGFEVFARNRGRSVARRELATERGVQTLYLKRFGRRHLKDDLGRVVRFKAPESLAESEWRALREMGEAGLPVAEGAAWGERRRWGRAVESMILIEEVSGEALEEILRGGRLSGAEVRRLARGLGALVRRMHEAGFSAPDLYAKHVFVDRSGGEGGLSIIDVQRVRRWSRVSMRRARKDLAALNASVPPGLARRTDRMRFLLSYLGQERLEEKDGALVEGIMRRTREVAHRRHIRGWETRGDEGRGR